MIICIFLFCSHFLAINARSLVSIENQNNGISRRQAETDAKAKADFEAEAVVPEGTNNDSLEIDISSAMDNDYGKFDYELDPALLDHIWELDPTWELDPDWIDM